MVGALAWGSVQVTSYAGAPCLQARHLLSNPSHFPCLSFWSIFQAQEHRQSLARYVPKRSEIERGTQGMQVYTHTHLSFCLCDFGVIALALELRITHSPSGMRIWGDAAEEAARQARDESVRSFIPVLPPLSPCRSVCTSCSQLGHSTGAQEGHCAA